MRNNLFKPILLASAFAHFGVIAGSAGFYTSPRFAVDAAPSSVDVQLIEEAPAPEPETILKAEESPVAVAESEPLPEPPKPQPVIERGAVSEAEPAAFSNPAPVYPTIARARGWEGRVVVKVLVRTDGSAGEVIVERSSGYQSLDRAAVEAIRVWRFIPAKAGGVSFESSVLIPVRFSLEK